MATHRAWKRLGGALGLLVIGALALTWLGAPEPPRAAFRPADAWSVGQGFAEGGRTFLTHGATGTVAWDAATWRPRPAWPLLACRLHAIGRDGRVGVGVHGHDDSNARVVVVDLATGEVRHRFEAGRSGVALAAFADDGRTVRAALADRQGFVREVASWDLATGSAARVLVGGPGRGPIGPQPVAFAPDGSAYAALDFNAGTLLVCDAGTGRAVGDPLKIGSNRMTFPVGVAFAPDGRALLVGRDDGRVDVWDRATARVVRTLAVHPSGKSARAIRFGPDGRTALSMGSDLPDRSALARFIDDVKGSLRLGRGGDSEVAAFDLATGRVLARWPGAGRVDLAPDGRTAVTREADGSFAVRDVPAPPPLPPHR